MQKLESVHNITCRKPRLRIASSLSPLPLFRKKEKNDTAFPFYRQRVEQEAYKKTAALVLMATGSAFSTSLDTHGLDTERSAATLIRREGKDERHLLLLYFLCTLLSPFAAANAFFFLCFGYNTVFFFVCLFACLFVCLIFTNWITVYNNNNNNKRVLFYYYYGDRKSVL